MKIQDILLASNVKRWGIVSTIRVQSVAEHAFNVTMIARAIAKQVDIEDDCNIIKYALDHDLDEIFTGDIPTPAKERLGLKTDYNGNSYARCSTEEAMIVKLADVIDALQFLIDNQVGRHAHQVADYLMDKYDQLCLLYESSHPKIVAASHYVINEITAGEYEAEQRTK